MNRKQSLNSVCLARCVHYIGFYVSHNWKKNIQCYKCKLARILLSVIDTRGHFEIFHIIKTRNAKVSIEKLSGHVFFFLTGQKLTNFTLRTDFKIKQQLYNH